MTAQSAKDPVQLALRGEIAILTINRPQHRNRLTPRIVDTFLLMFKALEADSEIKAVIIQGAGADFCAGEDVPNRKGVVTPDAFREMQDASERLVRAIEASPKIVIAKVRGEASGPGLDIVLCADLAIAASNAHLGAFPEEASRPAVVAPLSRSISPKHAMRLLLSPEPLSATEAASMGLISQVVSPDLLDEAVNAFANAVAVAPWSHLQFAKENLRFRTTANENTGMAAPGEDSRDYRSCDAPMDYSPSPLRAGSFAG